MARPPIAPDFKDEKKAQTHRNNYAWRTLDICRISGLGFAYIAGLALFGYWSAAAVDVLA
jgi:hypothetical protein